MPLYAVTIRITAVPDQVRDTVPEQEEAFRELMSAGRIRLVGRLEEDDGFLAVFEAADLLEAKGTVERFPLIANGMSAWTLRKFEELFPRTED
jgi:hypothetical protein